MCIRDSAFITVAGADVLIWKTLLQMRTAAPCSQSSSGQNLRAGAVLIWTDPVAVLIWTDPAADEDGSTLLPILI